MHSNYTKDNTFGGLLERGRVVAALAQDQGVCMGFDSVKAGLIFFNEMLVGETRHHVQARSNAVHE